MDHLDQAVPAEARRGGLDGVAELLVAVGAVGRTLDDGTVRRPAE